MGTKELIRVNIEGMVDVKELHAFLLIKTRINDWFTRRVEEYGFVEGVDFTLLKSEYSDLQCTTDMAKELCMVERSDVGKQARRYFIEVEQKWRLERDQPLSQLELMRRSVETLIENERKLKLHEVKLDNHEDRIALVEKAYEIEPDDGYRTVHAYATEAGFKTDVTIRSRIGKYIKSLCLQRRITVKSAPSAKYGKVNRYHIKILEKGFREFGEIYGLKKVEKPGEHLELT